MTAKTLRGSLEDHSRTKYSNQGPGKRSLPGRPTQAPARGACREETRPRQEELAGKATQGIPRKLAATRPASRQDPASDKLPDATRRRLRQGACRGKPPVRARAPAHLLTCRSRTLPSTRGRRLCSQGYAVASGDEEKAIVENGGAPSGHFLHCLGNSDRHLMPLSPAVGVR